LAKVERRLLADGRWFTIECAVEADGSTSPAASALDELKEGELRRDTTHDAEAPWPDEVQPGEYAKLMGWIAEFAERGLPPYQGAVNDLPDGIWEFKLGVKRVSFFDTPGDGTFEPKLRVVDRNESLYPEQDDFWWLPEFDEFVRLGHFFIKKSQPTSEEDKRECARIREEDVAHDAA
jgi:hypothetical protein